MVYRKKKIKIIKKWHKDDGLIFVFFTLNKADCWEYDKKFTKTWDWIGGGHTEPINGNLNYKYKREEQFYGYFLQRDKIKKYL